MKGNFSSKNKVSFQAPDFSYSSSDDSKAKEILFKYDNAIRKNLQKNLGDFSTLKSAIRMAKQSTEDPSNKFVIDTLKHFDMDKVNAKQALALNQILSFKMQNLQKQSLIQMLPYLVGLVATIVSIIFFFRSETFNFTNPTFIRNSVLLLISSSILTFGILRRKASKLTMLATNILYQSSAAYASARMQGKSSIAAIKNLEEMKTKAKIEQKKEAESKKKKKEKQKN